MNTKIESKISPNYFVCRCCYDGNDAWWNDNLNLLFDKFKQVQRISRFAVKSVGVDCMRGFIFNTDWKHVILCKCGEGGEVFKNSQFKEMYGRDFGNCNLENLNDDFF